MVLANTSLGSLCEVGGTRTYPGDASHMRPRAREWEQAEDRLFKVLRDASVLRAERHWRLRR
ncbi:hypothetical protein TPA0598_09_02770 [Streptomyces lydicamycinicus]|uniref:Uncharacterized protein n=1 Tax=Streptomyces lydicamycinicus TaxID=1546107 RepID=A0A0P4REA6_9ACTN|nr:hypothetical protein TPA0598_09_02770 [Streptomyces lydicamycinicus]